MAHYWGLARNAVLTLVQFRHRLEQYALCTILGDSG
jgi:hypothetical protein